MKLFFEGAAVVITLVVLVLWLTSPSAQADEPSAPIPTRTALRDAFACPGMHAEWLDDKTVQCLKEHP